MSFLQHGREAAQAAVADADTKSKNQFIRFFIGKDGDKKRTRFLDGDNEKTEPAMFKEHNVPIFKRVKGKMKKVWSQYTCLATVNQECPFCSPDNQAVTKYAYTLLDREGYTDKDDNTVREIRKLYVVGIKQYKALESFRAEIGNLRDRDIIIKRSGTGTDTTYLYIGKDKEKLVPDVTAKEREDFSLEVLDYEDLLKPVSRQDAINVLRSGKSFSAPDKKEEGDDGDSNAGDDDDIPF